ncbi:MAG: hypothetical protein ACTSQE_08900 [Candidatus Heimdallarchaeaceae archaeon]
MKINEDLELKRTKFKYTKKELLLTLVEAVKAYRVYENKQEWQPLALDTPTIARYLAYGKFESFLGATQHPGWVNLDNRVTYFLKKLAEKKGNKWIFYRDFESKVEDFLQNNSEIMDEVELIETQELKKKKGEEKSLEEQKEEMKFKSDFLVINFEDYVEEKRIYKCKLCEKIFDAKEETILHIKSHPLKLFLPKHE